MHDTLIKYLSGETNTLGIADEIKKLIFALKAVLLSIALMISALLGRGQEDTAGIIQLLNAGSYYLNKAGDEKKDFDKAHNFFRKAFALSRSVASDKWMNISIEWEGQCYIEESNLDSGKACFQKVIDFYHNNGNIAAEADAWKWMGDCIIPYRSHAAPEKARYLEHAYRLYWGIKDSLQALESLKAAADAHLYEPNLDLSESELLTVASIYKIIHFREIHFTYDLLRDVAELKGDLAKEVMYTMEMIQSVDSANLKNREDSLQAGRLYTYAGNAYAHAAMWDRAVFFDRKGWAALQTTEWNSEYFGVAAMFSLYLIHKGRAQEALQIVQTALHRRFLSDSYDKARIASSLGNCYWVLGYLEKAEAEFSNAARILNTEDLDLENPRHLQWKQEMIILIGNFYLSTHRYNKAKYYANRLPTDYTYLTTLRQRAEIELFRSRVDSAIGQYHSSLEHFATYRLMNDSLFGVQKTIQIQELQMKNALDKKDNDIHLQGANISLLAKENELQAMQAGKSRTLRNMMIIALMFLAFLVALIYNRYRVKQQKNSQLELKQNEITIKNHQLEQLLQENKWLLQEVHHRVKNNLQTVTSLLTSQMASTETGSALDAIRESRQRIEAIAMIHQRLYNSSNFNSIALPAYIADLVENLRVAFRPGPRIVFSLLTEPIVLDISAALPVGLILNEAISNSLKHAFPGNIQGTIVISVCKVSDSKIMFEVRDDGIGFSETSEISGKSFGIRLIKGLVSDISGESEIINNNGTVVRVLFSVDHLDSGQNMLVNEM